MNSLKNLGDLNKLPEYIRNDLFLIETSNLADKVAACAAWVASYAYGDESLTITDRVIQNLTCEANKKDPTALFILNGKVEEGAPIDNLLPDIAIYHLLEELKSEQAMLQIPRLTTLPSRFKALIYFASKGKWSPEVQTLYRELEHHPKTTPVLNVLASENESTKQNITTFLFSAAIAPPVPTPPAAAPPAEAPTLFQRIQKLLSQFLLFIKELLQPLWRT
jgi:hypothetical protein